MRPKTAVLLGVALATAASAGIPVRLVQVEAVKPGRVVFVTPVQRGDTLRLSFIHSVERSPVEEFFRIDAADRLVLYETRFRSLNTGLPTAASGAERFQREAGGFRLSNMQRVVPAVELWVHADYANTLHVGGRAVRLPLLAGNTLLRVSVRTVWLGRYLVLRWRSGTG